MFARIWTSFAFLLAALLIATAPLRAERIVAVGDLHGDYGAYHAIMSAAGLIDERDRWAGGDTILVQTGDIADRGPDSLRIIRHLRRLRSQAARTGGRVVTLLGNHEAMNVTGDLRYVHPGEFAAFADRRSAIRRERVWRANREAIVAAARARNPALTDEAIRETWLRATPLGWAEHRAGWHPEGELGRWALASPAVVLIDDTLFLHAGISPAYARLPIDEINRRVAAALAAIDPSREAIINDPIGPLWYRGLASGAEADVAAELEAILRAYGARRIVIGHTPVLDGIAVRHGGRLILIDTGNAAPYGGTRSWLEIRDGEVIPHVMGEEAP